MTEDKLTVGNVTFSVERAGERMVDTVYVGDLPDFRQQLAARLGCDVDKVTVENLVKFFDELQCIEETSGRAMDYGNNDGVVRQAYVRAKEALAPFKREAG